MLVKKQVREQRKEHQIRLSQRVAHVEGLEDIHVNPHGEKKKKKTRPECRTGTQCRPPSGAVDNDKKRDESHTMADAQTHTKTNTTK